MKPRPHIWADRISGGATLNIKDDDPGEGTAAVGGCVLTVIGLIFVPIFILNLPWLFSILDQYIENKFLLGSFVAAGAFGVSMSLFQLRKRSRRVYGLFEIMFALVTAWTAIGHLHMQGDLSVWLAFGGAAYLIVRGLDNLDVSRKKVDQLEAGSADNEGHLSEARAQQIIGRERQERGSKLD